MNQVINTILINLALFTPLIALLFSTSSRRWEIAYATRLAGLISAAAIWACVVFNVDIIHPFPLVHFTGVSSTVLLLVHFIGFIVLNYASRNFELDADNQRFLQWFLITLFSVMVTVVSNHLLVLWLGWVSISVSLHQLLMFYPLRYRAALAAHKKFIFARTAEVLLGIAFLLIYAEHGNAYIDQIFAQYPLQDLSVNLHIAAFLIANVVLIKCAQLPLHGWLIQVVESPTPVSALLHAGIINLGGLLLLLFAPLFSQSLPAQALVVIVASVSAVMAALVMMTITSIKVRLAWSTIAQMGLMLVECALGLYTLALLHLLAHSVYKAYAFLTAGEAVNQHVLQQQLQASSTQFDWAIASAVTLTALSTAIYYGWVTAPYSPWILLTGTAIVLLANRNVRATPLTAIVPIVALIALYITLKDVISTLLPNMQHDYYWQSDLLVSVLFVGLFVAYFTLFEMQHKALRRHVLPLLNAGFYLDEWSTRVTLRIWPISLPKKQAKFKIEQELKNEISNQA
jgi:NADH:ubiquinone oxidoreductase subunit 5 (subunit L)/multisubunit Na+/H+ antiporter MnhA subunit